MGLVEQRKGGLFELMLTHVDDKNTL